MVDNSSMIGTSVSERGGESGEPRLLVPADDVSDPELSIVIPALNEELTIGQFVDWCQEGLCRAQVRGEILMIDSSTDATAEIALLPPLGPFFACNTLLAHYPISRWMKRAPTSAMILGTIY